jgi:AcrR family transcriptional regulator
MRIAYDVHYFVYSVHSGLVESSAGYDGGAMVGEDRRRRGPGLQWRRRAAPSRGPKPGLSADEVVRAGIELADEEGLAALSMRRVAERLGFTTMSLYRHVPGKEELIEAMLDAAIGAPPAVAAGDWRTGLAGWGRANYAIHQRHRWLLLATVRRPPTGPNHLRWLDAGLQALAGLGLSGQEQLAVVLLVEHYVRGAAQLASSLVAEAEWGPGYIRTLKQTAADGRHPALAAVVAMGTFDAPSDGPDDFEFGLGCVLDGVAALIERRRE